jgi:tetratricopeptide (TPR) repeat protein
MYEVGKNIITPYRNDKSANGKMAELQNCRKALCAGAAALLLAAPCGAQIDPKTALVERAAWVALAAGRGRAAADAFREAIAADPKNARLHLGAGMAAALERRDADALGALQRALGLEPSLVQARALLGQVQYRMGDASAAIRTYEALVAATPGDPGPRATLDRWRREAARHDRMRQAIDAHFTVSFEGPAEERLATEALAALDRAYWRIGQLLGSYPSAPIPVVLYPAEAFRDITRSPAWAAGAYDGIIRVPVGGALERRDELDRVLAHEFTHALVRTLATRGVPTWLNEGLASALETGDLDWASSALTAGRPAISLQALQSGFGRLSAVEATAAYAVSAIAVRRLLDEAGGFAIANLLRDLGAGVDFETAFLHRMQRSFTDFQHSLF